MECTKIKQLLSRYIDGTLDKQKKVIVEGHLARCKFCSEEAASLKAYAKQRIKIPLWAITVVATVVLAIFVFKLLQPVKKIPYVPLAPEPKIIAKKPKEKPLEIAHKEEVAETATFLEEEPVIAPAEPTVAPAELVASAPIEEKPIELAILIKAEVPEKNGILSAEQVRLTDIVSVLKNRVSILEGTVISVEYRENTKIPQYITAKIPSRNYKTFLNQLDLYGSMESPPEGAVPLTEEQILIKIKLTYSE